VRQYEAETLKMFSNEQPQIGRRVRYAPAATAAPGAAEVAAILARGAADPLVTAEPGERGADGIVQGSERGERVYFWPMGIREPGAMRIWGRHATAFVGKRHFDDPDLLEKYFRRVE
jgi:hypothetical protein